MKQSEETYEEWLAKEEHETANLLMEYRTYAVEQSNLGKDFLGFFEWVENEKKSNKGGRAKS